LFFVAKKYRGLKSLKLLSRYSYVKKFSATGEEIALVVSDLTTIDDLL